MKYLFWEPRRVDIIGEQHRRTHLFCEPQPSAELDALLYPAKAGRVGYWDREGVAAEDMGGVSCCLVSLHV